MYVDVYRLNLIKKLKAIDRVADCDKLHFM